MTGMQALGQRQNVVSHLPVSRIHVDGNVLPPVPVFHQRSDALVVDTKPGLGAIDRAEFRGRVRFISSTDTTAE